MTRLSTFLGAAVTLAVTSAGAAFAQPVIQSPSPGQVFRAGPDYATDVLHDAWDFSNVDDVAPHPDDYVNWVESTGPAGARTVGPSAFFTLPGRFKARSVTGVPGQVDAMLGLLYQGTQTTVLTERTGPRYPIDTARYSKLAFRMKASNVPGGGSQPHAIWFFGPKPVSNTTMGTAVSPTFTTNGERVYQIDLVVNFSENAPYRSTPQAVGLRLDPTSDPSVDVEIDWVRLTAPDSSGAIMRVLTTNCSGIRTVDVLDGVTSTRVLESASDDASFNYGVFPPGAYTLRVACNGGSTDRAFTINAPPRITVLQPDEQGGIDFGAHVRGNPWDMDSLSDVAAAGNLDPGAVIPSPSGGLMFRGRNALVPGRPDLTGDPNLFLMYGEGAGRPIASKRYRYLTFTTQLHHAFDLGLGSVARVVWASATNFTGASPTVAQTATVTKDILIWPGRHTYTIDLGALAAGTGLEPCAPNGVCKPWTAGSPRFLRFDPHEFSDRQVVFDLDNVTLAAPDEVVQGQPFTVQWRLDDDDAGPSAYSATAYYALASSPASRTPIATATAHTPNAVNQIAWNTMGVAPGDYLISVDITEQRAGMVDTDTRVATSTGVLRVLPAVDQPIVTIATHASGATTHSPYTIAGCAYNGSTGAAADEVIVYAHPLQGQMGGVVQILGHNAPGGFGTLRLLPAASGWCAGPGYQVTDVFGLAPGQWTFRVLARNTLTGDFDEVQAQNVMVEHRSAAPRNLRLVSVSGNTVSIAWDPPNQGLPVVAYRIEAAADPGFAAFAPLVLPPHLTSVTGTIGNGTYYIRVVAGNNYSGEGIPSNVISFRLPGGGIAPGPPSAPGPPTLVPTQVAANPIVLSWSPGPGGTPTAYTLLAGTAPGSANLGTFPMRGATEVSAMAPQGRIYVRVIASNAGGNATSNEIDFAIVPPPAPTMNPPGISGRNVTLSWTPAPGAPATRYVVLARYPGQQAVLVSLPTTATGLFVPNAPPGTYIVSVVAINGTGASAESNPVIVPVP